MSFPYLDETKELNESTRKAAGGSFIALTDGVTHYELRGDSSTQTVVLVHGFSVPCFIFDPTFEFLTQAGMRVLRYDLFGRGYSDRPRARYDIHLFVRQLKDLLDALNLTDVNLAGLSMGGPISAAFIDRHPEFVRRHILIDPAGAEKIELPLTIKAARLPLLAELVFGLMGSGNLLKSVAADMFDQSLVEHFQNRYKPQMQFKGFKRALLSTMRSGMLDSFYETYARVGQLHKPTLLIWGENDPTIPYAHSAKILQAIPHAQLLTVAGGGHIPHYEQPDAVNPALLQFLYRENHFTPFDKAE